MIVECPNCSKQVSSKASLCNQCGFEIGEATPEELQEYQRRKLRDRIYHLKMWSYSAIMLLLIACGWYWYESSDFTSPPTLGPALVLAAGALGYIVVRFLLIVARRKLKKLR